MIILRIARQVNVISTLFHKTNFFTAFRTNIPSNHYEHPDQSSWARREVGCKGFNDSPLTRLAGYCLLLAAHFPLPAPLQDLLLHVTRNTDKAKEAFQLLAES